MPLIVIRLHPDKPVVGTSFSAYLDGLEIEVSDRSFGDPGGTEPTHVIGSAKYDPGGTGTIVQHLVGIGGAPPVFVAAPIATAAIDIAAPTQEYLSRDLRLTVTRDVGGTKTPVVIKDLDFNVALDSDPLPGTQDPFDYHDLGPVALYLALPPSPASLPPGTTFLDVPTDGSPVPYAAVLTAMQAVVAQDPGPGAPPDLAALTPAQARHIAREIEFNRVLEPLPAPSADLEVIYSGGNEDARRQFEGDLITYYAVHTTKADVLTKFVYGVSAALACQAISIAQPQVGMTVPVFPGLLPVTSVVPTVTVVVSQ
jgi:hypothetical protein